MRLTYMRVGSAYYKKLNTPRHSGFTLVELLVVMGIMAVLAAIIFPVVSKAKEMARISQCQSNMKQMGAALNIYLNEFDGRFPNAAPWGAPTYWARPENNNQKTFQALLLPYVRNGMNVLERNVSKTKVNGKTVTKTTILYAKAGVFVCPCDTGIPSSAGYGTIWDVPPGKPIWQFTGCSYEYYAEEQLDVLHYSSANPRFLSWTALSPQIRTGSALVSVGAPISAITYPSKKAVLGDVYFWHMGDVVPNEKPVDVHDLYDVGMAYRNTLFADGHAARVIGSAHNAARAVTLIPWHSPQYVEIRR